MEEDNYDDILTTAIGKFGRWHTILVILIIIPTKFSLIWVLLSIIFLAPKTTFRCIDMINSTATNSSREILNSTCYSDCMKYEYYSEFENTIISEWDLICEREWLANLSQIACMFGVLVGSIIFGFFADRCGRKPTLLFSCMLQLITSLATPFCPNYWIFAVLRFIIGTSTAGIMITSYIIMVEVTGPSKREIMNSLVTVPAPCGELLMPLFAYFLRSWDKFCLGIAIPNVLFLLYFFLAPESPRWLVSIGRLEQASKVMKRAAKCNNLSTENMLAVSIAMDKEAKTSKNQKMKASYVDLFLTPSLRWNNFCSCIIWFMMGLSYYGSHQYIGQTSSNVYATIGLAGASQIPGVLLSSWCCKLIGRRLTIITFMVVSAISNALLVVPDDWFYVKLVVGSLGISSAAGAFAALYMYTSELFPTVARNMALGTSSMSSRIGSMLAPFVVGLNITTYWLPPAVFAVAPLIATVASYCLPETKGKKMNDLLDE